MPSFPELAGRKEKENYEEFLQQYTEQLAGIQAALDDTFGEAWDFSLDPIALQVSVMYIVFHLC